MINNPCEKNGKNHLPHSKKKNRNKKLKTIHIFII